MASPKDTFGLEGQTLDGHYRVDKLIGEGGFSFVYRATDLASNEAVAVKCLKLSAGDQVESAEAFVRRFRDEGRLLYRLSQESPDIVRCMVAGATTSPLTREMVPYLVLEWLSGRNLSADLRDRRARNLHGRSLAEVIALFDPVASALAHAHSHGVVHRDIKPPNLFLAEVPGGTPRLKVLDFGVAKCVNDTMGMTLAAATASNFMMCSPSYAAPEQFDPRLGPPGPWTDVYSFALIVLEALRDAKLRQSKGLIAAMVEALDPTVNLSASALGISVPAAVERVLLSATSIDPRARPQSASDFWRDFTEAARPAPRAAGDFAATIAEPERHDPGVTVVLSDGPLSGTPRGAAGPDMQPKTVPLAWAPSRPPQPLVPVPPSSSSPWGPPPSSGAPWPASARGPLSPRLAQPEPPPNRRGIVLAAVVAIVAVVALVIELLAWQRMQ